MVKLFDDLFEGIHRVVISFFFKLGVFTPALVNALLVGFGIGSFAFERWGMLAAVLAGVSGGLGIEAASIISAWNMDINSKWRAFILPILYVVGSWTVVLFGLRDGWLVDIVGIVMPIFAVTLPTVIAKREQKQAAQVLADERRETALNAQLKQKEIQLQEKQIQAEIEKEKTKQARAAARANKNGKMSREEALEFIKANPDMGATEIAGHIGVSRRTVYNYLEALK